MTAGDEILPAPPAKKVAKAAKKTEASSAKAPPKSVAKAAKKAAGPAKAPAAKAAKKAAKAPAAPAVAWVAAEGGTCPPSHPVKAKLSSRLFHLPGMLAYDRTRPDRCYADEATAVADGLTKAKR